jgi:hypothetical protein
VILIVAAVEIIRAYDVVTGPPLGPIATLQAIGAVYPKVWKPEIIHGLELEMR